MTFVKQSTGWATEALIALIVILALAGIGDLAGKYGLSALEGTAGQVLQVGLGVLAAITARRREQAKRDAQESATSRAGA